MNLKKATLHALSAHEGINPYKKPSHLQDGWLKQEEHRTTKHILGRPSAFAKVLKGTKKGVVTSPIRTPINWDSARVRDTYSIRKYPSLLLPTAKPVPDVSKWQSDTSTKQRAGFRKTHKSRRKLTRMGRKKIKDKKTRRRKKI